MMEDARMCQKGLTEIGNFGRSWHEGVEYEEREAAKEPRHLCDCPGRFLTLIRTFLQVIFCCERS